MRDDEIKRRVGLELRKPHLAKAHIFQIRPLRPGSCEMDCLRGNIQPHAVRIRPTVRQRKEVMPLPATDFQNSRRRRLRHIQPRRPRHRPVHRYICSRVAHWRVIRRLPRIIIRKLHTVLWDIRPRFANLFPLSKMVRVF